MEQQAVAKGDVRFFELAYLEATSSDQEAHRQRGTQRLRHPQYRPDPRGRTVKVKKWSDYIDYWAVDWHFQNDTFMQGWVAYRTPNERKLPFGSDVHIYANPSRYRILVKVIDIFGNDTSQAFDVEVK